MGIMDIDLFIDFASALSLVALLAWGYGTIRRRVAGRIFAPIILGALFGFVAFLQMHAPIEPFDGLIIDLRAVPIALAGAYLGFTGMAVCVTIAALSRYDIGGVGMTAGIVGIFAAGFGSMLWDRMTAHRTPRNVGYLVLLALTVSVSLFSGVVLPDPLGAWFLTNAAPVLLVTYLIAIPLVAALLERERVMLATENQMRASGQIDPQTGLVTVTAFAKEVAALSAIGTGPASTGVLILNIRHRGFLSAHWGEAIVGHILAGLRLRLSGLVRHGNLMAKTRSGEIAIAVTEDEMAQIDDLIVDIRRAIDARAIALPGGDAVRVRLNHRVVPLADATDASQILEQLGVSTSRVTSRPAMRKPLRIKRAAHPNLQPLSHPKLFAEADRLMKAAER